MAVALLDIANRSSSLEERHVRKRSRAVWLVEFADRGEMSTSPDDKTHNADTDSLDYLEDAMRIYRNAWLSLEMAEALQ